MQVKELRLVNFRNNRYSELGFTDGVNVIYGENAAGKTNILESIFYFAAGKSFRNCKDRELIYFGEDGAAAELCFGDSRKDVNLGVKIFKNRKREFLRNGNTVTKLSEYLGAFRAVIFTPDHLNLVKGQPENRRRFIDLAICQSYPRYVSYLSEYNRILLQKNALLKQDTDKGYKADMIGIYNEKLSAAAAAISFNRRRFLKQLEECAASQQEEISGGKEVLRLKYNGCFEEEPETAEETRVAMLAYLNSKREAEILRGISLFGVHKDDFTIYLNNKNGRFFASQGQQRSAVLALKLAEGEMSRKVTGEYPVFLFDDILSELDEGRRSIILKKTGGRQVIITGCEKDYFSALDVQNRIKVEKGMCFCETPSGGEKFALGQE
ncbi:MAG: DNA replication/repair protein RecF [Ruminococcaceae bacterium]|nr:DNA replication/repair protein RecF [Oscillospiraceae bacterium]